MDFKVSCIYMDFCLPSTLQILMYLSKLILKKSLLSCKVFKIYSYLILKFVAHFNQKVFGLSIGLNKSSLTITARNILGLATLKNY